MPALKRIPATVVTGFLGAGKTTLIRHILENANGERIALIINEFGDVGVDGEVLKSCGDEACRDDDIVELANGCICCTVADDFVPVMENLIARKDPPDHIVIETSGLALPQPLIRAFNWPEISANVTVDGVVAVVDGPALADGRFASDVGAVNAQRAADPGLDHESPLHELFEDQIASADMVLVNKADLIDEETLARISSELAGELRPGAALVPTRHGKMEISALLGLGAAAESDLASRKSHHEASGEDDHDHDDFITFAVNAGRFANRDELLGRLEQVLKGHDILRLKGFAALEDNPSRLVVQATGPRLSSYFDRPWRDDETPATSLVVIGLKGLDETAITTLLGG
ncbi:MAG TPA: cobalamin biosynthesis protein CobW [Rhizobiales bacterium]|nr:cobalamin biosynthesis protein CobW [Hyphomicrobiales bacterium]